MSSDLPFRPLPPRGGSSAPAFQPTAPAPTQNPRMPSTRPAQSAPVPPAPSQQQTPQPNYGTATPRPTGRVELDALLTAAVRAGASDIHFASNAPARYRVDGELILMPEYPEALSEQWLSNALKGVLSEDLWARYQDGWEADASHTVEDVARFRVNAFVQRGMPGSVFRVIPSIIKTVDELGVPQILKEIAKKPKGLVLVTGPTGSGKSTTLTAMIDAINDSRAEHIMTIEDPIEFVHTSKKSVVNQREVGADTKSFAEALKRVLRQDPDVILVGELRDGETISTALTAAETGHLVFGTLHTQSASKTIDRIIDSFPANQQQQVKAQLADTLQAVIAQTLMKKVGGGRVAATEIMTRTSGIANMIREGQIAQLYSAIQTGSNYGMHTLDQDLVRLVGQGLITKENARPYMIDPRGLDNVSTGSREQMSYDDWSN